MPSAARRLPSARRGTSSAPRGVADDVVPDSPLALAVSLRATDSVSSASAGLGGAVGLGGAAGSGGSR